MKFILRIFIQNIDYDNRLNLNVKKTGNNELNQNENTDGYDLDVNEGSDKHIYYNIIDIIKNSKPT